MATALDADAPTGAAAAATDVTAAEPVYDGPGPDAPGSATFRALAWSQEDDGEDPFHTPVRTLMRYRNPMFARC